MICPHCKKGRLQRRRTYDKGERVLRASKCDRCNIYTNTIEMTETAYQSERQRTRTEIESGIRAIESIKDRVREVQEARATLETASADLSAVLDPPMAQKGPSHRSPGRSRPGSRKISKTRKP